MFRFDPLSLSGAFLVQLPAFEDERGSFIKTYHQDLFVQEGLAFTMKESYYSSSHKGVIRGMHFQLPPHQHSKIVFCPRGAILDVILDLRKEQKTYGQYFKAELSAANHQALYIPEGFAHGFKALADDSLTCYFVSSQYHKEADTGIRYDSFGMNWDEESPVVSPRDLSFAGLPGFESPF